MRPICFALLFFAAACARHTLPGTPVRRATEDPHLRLEFRFAEQYERRGWQPVVLASEGRTLYVAPDVIVSNADIEAVSIAPARSQHGIYLLFTQAAGKRLEMLTGANIGARLAIIVDGKAILAPVLQSALNREAVIDSDLSEAEALRLARGLAP